MAGSNIRKRSDGRYELRFTFEGKRYSVYGATRKECKEKELEKRQMLSSHCVSNATTITVEQYFEQWIDSKKGQVKPSSICAERIRFGPVNRLIGKKKMVQLDRIMILDLQKQLATHLEANTVNQTISLASTLCKEAVLDGILASNPCVGVRRLRITKKPARETIHRALTEEEQRIFFGAIQNDPTVWYKELYELAVLTGLRFGELGALTWEHIDFNKKLIHVRQTLTADENRHVTVGPPKTKTSRRDIPLTKDMEHVIARQKKKLAEFWGKQIPFYVFPSQHGEFLQQLTVTNELTRICKKLSIDRFTFHAFRDTFATNALRSGMAPNTLKTILGHASYAMTMDLYAHVLDDTKREEMGRIHFIL